MARINTQRQFFPIVKSACRLRKKALTEFDVLIVPSSFGVQYKS